MSDRTCSLPGCARPLIARELCSMHYQRLVLRGTTDARPPAPPKPPCSVEGCGKVSASRGWCHMHYRRWRMNGTLDDPTPRSRREHCAVNGCDAGGRMTRGLCARHYWRLKNHGDTGPVALLLTVHEPDAVCSVEGCDRPGPLRRTWCATHYQRWEHHGDPTYERVFPDVCTIPGCERKHESRGLCGTHYMRLLRTGSTADPQPATSRPCRIDDCDGDAVSHGLCSKHRARMERHGSTDAPSKAWTRSPTGRCEIAGCNAPHQSRGLCSSHYQQERHDMTRDASNARMRAHYEANREYYYAKTDQRRGLLASLSSEDRTISAAYRRVIATDRCGYCGAQGEHNDHVFPLAKGGSDHWWNLIRACAPCNKSKAAHCGTWFRLRRGIGVAA